MAEKCVRGRTTTVDEQAGRRWQDLHRALREATTRLLTTFFGQEAMTVKEVAVGREGRTTTSKKPRDDNG